MIQRKRDTRGRAFTAIMNIIEYSGGLFIQRENQVMGSLNSAIVEQEDSTETIDGENFRL